MFRIFQRSQFNSNSQHSKDWSDTRKRCFEYFKDLNLTAIHNKIKLLHLLPLVFRIFQRSQFNSNSQQQLRNCKRERRCFEYFKDLNLTAIHNNTASINMIVEVFRIFQRSQFNSNSQQFLYLFFFLCRCFEYFKDLNLTAIHNPRRNNRCLSEVFRIFQRSQFNSNSQQVLYLPT